MPSMKGITKFLTAASWLICVNALSQTKREKAVETNFATLPTILCSSLGSWCRFELKFGLTRLA